MSVVLRLAKNTLAVGLGKLISPCLNFFLIIYIARILGEEPFGLYSFVVSYLLIFQSIATLGFSYLIPREVAKCRADANKYLVNGGLIELFSAVLFLFVMFAIAAALRYPTDTLLAVAITGLALLPSTLNSTFEAIYVSFERAEFIALVNVGENLFKVVFSLLLLILGYGLLPVFGVIVLSRVLALGLNLFFVRRYFFKPRLELDLGFCRGLVRTAIVFGLIELLAYVFVKVDIVMLSKMRGMAEVGQYSAAWKILEIFFLIPGSLILVIMPLYSQVFVKSRESFQGLIEQGVKIVWILLFPLALLVTFHARQLITLLFGPAYQDAVLALQIVIWALIPFSADGLLGKSLIAAGLQKADLWILSIGALGNIALNLVLISRYGLYGASISTVLSVLVTLAIHYAFLRSRHIAIRLLRVGWKPAAGILAMGFVHVFLRPYHASLQAAAGVLAYGICMWLLKGLTQEDVLFLKGLKRYQHS